MSCYRFGMKVTMYLTMPRKDCSCCLSDGAVISLIPCTFFGFGCMPWVLYSDPKNVTLSLQSSSFLLFSARPSSLHMFKRLIRFASWSSWSTPKITISLYIPMTLGHCSRMASICSWNTSWLILTPNGILRKQRHPLCELNVIKRDASCVRCICKKAFKASALVYTVALASSWVISSTVVGLWCSLMMALFKLLGSRHTLTSPFGFIENVTHGVGSTCSMMISSSIK